MDQKNPNLKQELKIVFSPELTEELKYCFYPEQLAKIKYRPITLDGDRWQCSCGEIASGDTCPNCGMQKTLAFGKINARYLDRHRKERLAMMNTLVRPTRKPKKSAKSRIAVFAVVLLIAALAVGAIIMISNYGKKNPPPPVDPIGSDVTTAAPVSSEDPETTGIPETTKEPESTAAPETTKEPETTESPETTKEPETTKVPETTSPSQNLPTPENYLPSSGNEAMGGEVYSAEKYDYVAKNGLTECDKKGNAVRTLTNEKVSSLCGFGSDLFYVRNGNVCAYDLTQNVEKVLAEGASSVVTAHETVYFVSSDGRELFRLKEGKTESVYTGTVRSMNASAGKLFFSTNDGMYRVVNADAGAENLNPGGAGCSGVVEMDNLFFYTVYGQLMAYRESDAARLGVYGLDGWQYTAIIACGDRVYYRAEQNGAVTWFETNILFQYKRDTGVHTKNLYVTSGGLYDGELNFVPIA